MSQDQHFVAAVMRGGLIMASTLVVAAALAAAPDNPEIDYRGFRQIVQNTQATRDLRRLDEPQFVAAMQQPGVVILDARSADAFALRHVRGAVNLPFTDFTAARLAKLLPTPDTPVLIYCNNNFGGSPTAFPTKVARASLNLATWTSLRAYGYDNVYELGPYLQVTNTAIPFDGTEVAQR